LPPSHGAGDRN